MSQDFISDCSKEPVKIHVQHLNAILSKEETKVSHSQLEAMKNWKEKMDPSSSSSPSEPDLLLLKALCFSHHDNCQ